MLRSSFRFRMLLLVALCLLVPGAIFGYLSLRQVEAKFRQETVRRMRLQSRGITMTIHSGFSSIEHQVEFLAGILGDGTLTSLRFSPDWDSMFRGQPLLGATRFRDGSRAEALFGNPCPFPPMTDAARNHLAAGNGQLYVHREPAGPSRFFVAHAIPGMPPERELLVCEVNIDSLWERVRDAIPPVSEVAVLFPDGAPLFQSRPLTAALLGRVERNHRSGPAGNFEWGQGSGTLLVDHSAVFLKPAFLSDDWIVVVTQPRSEAFAAANRFTRILFLTIALVVLVAGLFAHVQIRRNVAPLAVLEEGTRRISGGDFDSRVEIGSGDEFEELARSFNTMADHLGKEFRIQAELARIVQTILGETVREKVVRALLDNVNSVVPCDCAGLSLLGTAGREYAAVAGVREGMVADPSAAGKAVLPLRADEIDRLNTMDTSMVAEPGGEFDHLLSLWPGPPPAALLLSPLVSRGELLGALFLGYRNPPALTREIPIRLRQIADQTAIALSRARLLEELTENDLGTLQALSRAVDTNSPWTAGHSQRVTALAMEIGQDLGLPPQDIDLLRRGGLLHDIGKLGIPSSILDKPGRLTEEEYAVIRRHPSAGAEILDPIPNLEKIIPIVSQHHERFDGKGYPSGLAGEAISLHARIVAVADVVDALSSDRPYRQGWPLEKVLVYVRENARRQFDPVAADSFLRGSARWAAAGRPEPPRRAFSGYSEPVLHG